MHPAVSKGSKNVHRSDYKEVFPLPKAASCLHVTPFWMYGNILTHAKGRGCMPPMAGLGVGGVFWS